MEHIREYLISVTAAALLCGIIRSLAGEKGSTGGILRLVCGIFLSLSVIRPVADVRLRDFCLMTNDVMDDAQAAVLEGEDYAQRAMARLIKAEAEAYILDKALIFDADITAEVTVGGETPVPVACIIRGSLSPYAKQQLESILEQDLGIRKEDQHWIS